MDALLTCLYFQLRNSAGVFYSKMLLHNIALYYCRTSCFVASGPGTC